MYTSLCSECEDERECTISTSSEYRMKRIRSFALDVECEDVTEDWRDVLKYLNYS